MENNYDGDRKEVMDGQVGSVGNGNIVKDNTFIQNINSIIENHLIRRCFYIFLTFVFVLFCAYYAIQWLNNKSVLEQDIAKVSELARIKVFKLIAV